MTQLDKALARLRARPAEASFADVRTVLEYAGYQLGRQRGSHVAFVHPEKRTLTFPLKHGKVVKRPYIDDILELLDADD